MERRRHTTALMHWGMTVSGVILLAIACLGSALFLYGDGNPGASTTKTFGLENIVLGELIGSTSYTPQAVTQQKNLLNGVGDILHLPYSSPLKMLTAQFPETNIQTNQSDSGQASLLGSISNWVSATHKIALGWAPDASVAETEARITDNPGMNVLSPSWLTLKNTDGQITDDTQNAVVQFAHARHIAVWALFDNQFNQKLSHAVLSNSARRTKLVQTVVNAAVRHHLDGINVDFENLDSVDRDYFTQFIRDLHVALAIRNMKLSVDITPDIVSLNDDAVFFHAGLAAVSDYVILMAYDEHWSTDQTPGPVADVPWVTQSVSDLLDTGVPTDKLVLGIPFYARFWYIHKDGSVTSEAVSTTGVEPILNAHKATAHWLPNLRVMYARYSKPDGYEEVWFETKQTLQDKLNLVNQTGLAGVAVWSLQLSNQNAWNALVDALQQSLS